MNFEGKRPRVIRTHDGPLRKVKSLSELLKQERNNALEEAAKIADSEAKIQKDGIEEEIAETQRHMEHGFWLAQKIAARIRAAKVSG